MIQTESDRKSHWEGKSKKGEKKSGLQSGALFSVLTSANLHSRIKDSCCELLLREGEGLLSGKAVVLNQVNP